MMKDTKIIWKKKRNLEARLDLSRVKCEGFQRVCDSLINSIKSLSNSVMDFDEFIQLVSSSVTNEVIESVNSGNMLKVTYEGKEYYIVNTEINCIEYEQYVKQNGLFQSFKKYENGALGGICGGDCLHLASFYACDMLSGRFSSRDRMTSNDRSYSAVKRMDSKVSSEEPEDVLAYLYQEALAGRPTVLQVSQEDSNVDGSRHFVTVVGFDSSVTCLEDLTPDKIFVLDCVDGKLQTLAQSKEEGGHERDLYAWKGNKDKTPKYNVRGATSDFKNEECDNDKWMMTHSVKRKAQEDSNKKQS